MRRRRRLPCRLLLQQVIQCDLNHSLLRKNLTVAAKWVTTFENLVMDIFARKIQDISQFDFLSLY